MMDDNLRAALKHAHGFCDEGTLSKSIDDGEYKVIRYKDSTICVEFVEYPTGLKTIEFPFAGGKLSDIKEIEPSLLRWGREEGCQMAVIRGRAKWAPVLGYRPLILTMGKGL
jgi:hypothetical protein